MGVARDSGTGAETAPWLPNNSASFTIEFLMSQVDPFMPSPEPIPAQALAYSMVGVQRRPGIVTAIAVLCIVIACLSGLSSLILGIYGCVFWMMGVFTSAMASASAASAPATAAAPPAFVKLSLEDAGVAVNALQSKLALDGAHVRELSRLLRTHGREIFGGDEDAALSTAQVNAAVQWSTPQPTDRAGPAQFSTAQGSVEIYADRAVFTSADASRVVQTSAVDNSDSATGPPPTPSAGGRNNALTPAEINQLILNVQQSAAVLNPAQVAALRAELSKPNQRLVTPGASSSTVFAAVQTGGNATIQFNRGNMLVLGPQGQVISSGPIRFPKISISAGTAGLVIGEAATSCALAIYLLIVGILAFRPARRVPLMLRIYAVLKIPLAVLAGVGVPWMVYQVVESAMKNTMTVAGTPAAPPPTGPFIGWGIGIALVGMAFPVAVLIALVTRTCKSYYSPPAVD